MSRFEKLREHSNVPSLSRAIFGYLPQPYNHCFIQLVATRVVVGSAAKAVVNIRWNEIEVIDQDDIFKAFMNEG
eukprot:756826-Amorphochlora_amoeboformis.AAC.1